MRVLAVLLLVAPSLIAAAEWALLVAGSNGYYNYRHQSDVCHSYHVLRNNGFPADHIITMLYDDIANDPENPVKNNLINHPDGPNVYDGCEKDYTGSAVTPQNFLRILSGQSMSGIGTERTIESNENDSIFVFFSDHGATGLVAFPSDYLYANDLNATITQMFNEKKYKQMLLYIEACEAGSMFNGILNSNINVLAVTASDPTHSSYAVYYDDSRQTYLGDVFSVNWMEDSDKNSPVSETIKEQVDVVRQETNTSAVCSYGDDSIQKEFLAQFIGDKSASSRPRRSAKFSDSVDELADSRDVELMILKHRVAAAAPADRALALERVQEVMETRKTHDSRIAELVHFAQTLAPFEDVEVEYKTPTLDKEDPICKENYVADFDCLKQLVQSWRRSCGEFDSYSLKHVAKLNKICGSGANIAAVAAQMPRICH